jgi:hypothetical protein
MTNIKYFFWISNRKNKCNTVISLLTYRYLVSSTQNLYKSRVTPVDGRSIAQAFSRCLPTAAARVRSRVWSSGFCGGQSGAGAGFLRVLRFPLPIFIPPIAPQSPSRIIWGWYNRTALPALPHMSSWSVTELIEHTNNFIFTFNYI